MALTRIYYTKHFTKGHLVGMNYPEAITVDSECVPIWDYNAKNGRVFKGIEGNSYTITIDKLEDA